MTVIGLPILYSFRRCPYAMRARMALFASGMQVALREVVLKDKPHVMLSVSPKGTVPVLCLSSGEIIDESLEVMLWALAQNDPQDWFRPDEGTKESMLSLVERCDGDFKHHLDRYKYANRYEGVDADVHRREAEVFLSELEGRLNASPYLFGQSPALADYAIMPFIRQFANTGREWFDEAPYPALQKWLACLLAGSPFTNVMHKYAQWQEDDVVVLFPEAKIES